MKNRDIYPERDIRIERMVKLYQSAKAEGKTIYLDVDNIVEIADWYTDNREKTTAQEVIEYGLMLHPKNIILMIEKANICLDNGKIAEAKDVVSQISDMTCEVYILKATILMLEGKVKEADAMIDSIDEKDYLPNIIDVSYFYIENDFPEKALPWLSRALDEDKDDEDYLNVLAECYLAQGLSKKASTIYTKLIDLDPYSATYWFGLARCHFDKQKFDEAIEACDYAITADENFANAYTLRGHAFYQLDNEEMAIENYLQAEKLGGVSPSFIHSFIGLCKVARGEWEDAYNRLEKAIAMNNDDNLLPLSTLYANAALCLYKMGQKDKAYQYCEKSHELSPKEFEPYLIEGRINMEEGDEEKGSRNWELALRYSPYPETWYEIGICSMEIGAFEYARRAFERVKELSPNFERINEKLTSLYLILEDKENFMKYNQLCKNPFKLEDLKELEKELEKENQKDLAAIMKSILSAF